MTRFWVGSSFVKKKGNGRNEYVGRVEEQDGGAAWLWRVFERGPIIAKSGEEPTEAEAKAAVEAHQNAYKGYVDRDFVTAVHEAAHAVVAQHTDFLVFTSDLVADTEAPGIETARNNLLVAEGCKQQRWTKSDIDRMHSGVFAAGFVAEKRYLAGAVIPYDGFICLCGATGDRKTLEISRMATWDDAKLEAERVLNLPGVWDGVIKVAKVLAERDIALTELRCGIIKRIAW